MGWMLSDMKELMLPGYFVNDPIGLIGNPAVPANELVPYPASYPLTQANCLVKTHRVICETRGWCELTGRCAARVSAEQLTGPGPQDLAAWGARDVGCGGHLLRGAALGLTDPRNAQ